MYFSSAWDVVTPKEEIDNRDTSKIDKIFFIYIITFASLLAYSSYHFSINLDIERLQFCKEIEKNLSIFVQICREKKFFVGKYRG